VEQVRADQHRLLQQVTIEDIPEHAKPGIQPGFFLAQLESTTPWGFSTRF
jgi:hypothetical protein